MNIATLLELASSLDPTRTILSDASGHLTLQELQQQAGSLAATFRSAPLEGPVAYLGVNSNSIPLALFGAALSARPFVPLNFRADKKLLEYFLEEVRPAVVITDRQYQEQLRTLISRDVMVLLSDSLVTENINAAPATLAASDSPAILLFTSGTSAMPKVVVLQHTNLTSYVMNSTIPMSEPADAATLIAAPAYHVAAVANILTSVYTGRRISMLASFDASSWLDQARRESVTHAFVVPTMLARIVAALKDGASPPPTLRTLAYGGAHCDPLLVRSALGLFASTTGFINAYGLTETSSTLTVLGPEDHRVAVASTDKAIADRLGSVGKPLPGVDLRIAVEETPGEILVKGPQVSGSYTRAPNRWDSSGWFHTGDIGFIDGDGYVFVTGRLDDMIVRGGENVSPLEIENALLRCVGVTDAAVVGVPDQEWGQRIEAAIVLDESAQVAAVEASLVELLPSFKRPARIHVFDVLPRTDLGKLQRSKVRMLLGESAPPVKQ